jgi:hypothetical protein
MFLKCVIITPAGTSSTQTGSSLQAGVKPVKSISIIPIPLIEMHAQDTGVPCA